MGRLDETGQQRDRDRHEECLEHLEKQSPAGPIDDDREPGLRERSPFGGIDAGKAAAGLVAVGILHRLEAGDAVAGHRHAAADGAGRLVRDEEEILPGILGVLERSQKEVTVEGEIHDPEGLHVLDMEPLEDEMLLLTVDLAEHLAGGDRAADGNEVVEGIEFGPPRGGTVLLPSAPDVDHSPPPAVVEGNLLHRLHIETDRHAARPVGGGYRGSVEARIGLRRIERRLPRQLLQPPRFPLGPREEERGGEEQQAQQPHPGRQPARLEVAQAPDGGRWGTGHWESIPGPLRGGGSGGGVPAWARASSSRASSDAGM